uniref:Low density lipoprotein receptor adaptor protein 1b n=1 Tax=Neolamprologus brichardi TaxID=32507 RepID=A0A3Q4H9U4_NEOBR
MDALKSAGRAIIRSPSIAKQSWGAGRHKKLPENWTDTRETLLEGMMFQLKYLGVTMVEQPKGEELSAAAVKRIVATAKASGKKLQKVSLTVSPRGIILRDSASNQLIENVSIYRISYCTADKMHDKVFAYIVQSQHNETLECHAFLCAKRKMAQAVTLTVAQAFKVAFEFWQAAKEGARVVFRKVATGTLLDLAEGANAALTHSGTNDSAPAPQSSLELQMEAMSIFYVQSMVLPNNKMFFLFFLPFCRYRLAESRTNPQVLDIGVNPQDFSTEECLSPGKWDQEESDFTAQKDTWGF